MDVRILPLLCLRDEKGSQMSGDLFDFRPEVKTAAYLAHAQRKVGAKFFAVITLHGQNCNGNRLYSQTDFPVFFRKSNLAII